MAGTKVIVKKSSVAGKKPVAGDLEIGELAINVTDKKLYSKNAAGYIIEISSSSGSRLDGGNYERTVVYDNGDSNPSFEDTGYDGGSASS
ncbi:MAG: hypothetical protein CMD98_04650 [Gammaproteobacteria bacterium]|nr:hypothetical protein [Gammaproteobacteria bacterium]